MKARILAAILMAGTALGASPALAQAVPDISAASDIDVVDAVASPAVAVEATEALQSTATAPDTLSDTELSGQRGGEGIVVTNQTLTAVTSGNVINGDYMAGAVSLTDNALSSFNGVGNLLINTGAQVSLQTGMNLTINVTDD